MSPKAAPPADICSTVCSEVPGGVSAAGGCSASARCASAACCRSAARAASTAASRRCISSTAACAAAALRCSFWSAVCSVRLLELFCLEALPAVAGCVPPGFVPGGVAAVPPCWPPVSVSIKRCESLSNVDLLPSNDSNPLQSMQNRHHQLLRSDEPDPAANCSRTGSGYSCFFDLVVPPVQRRTNAACASIIWCALSCQSFTNSWPTCAPVPGSGLKLISLAILNQPCQSSRSASAQFCSCSRPSRASSRNSSGVPLALARASVH